MHRVFRCLLLILTVLPYFACNGPSVPDHVLNESRLPLQTFGIDVRKDTLVQTAGGARIHIPAGALTAAAGTVAGLRIREAYDITSMLTAGLTTTSAGRPLSSGGMIWLDADSNTRIAADKGIAVSIPTRSFRPGMQVFKGKRAEDGTMDWSDPAPLAPMPRTPSYASGERLFNSLCVSCHHLTRDATGPALAYLYRRRDWDWLKAFTRNPSAMIAAGDPYAVAIFCRWKPTVMTAFPELSDAELRAIYDYLEAESYKVDPDRVPDDKASLDSCALYARATGNAEWTRAELIRRQLADGAGGIRGDDDLVAPSAAPEVYYRFTVRAEGWYNIDILTEDLPGFSPARVLARLDGHPKKAVRLYLVLPDDKVLLNGGPADGKDGAYAFYRKDGSIPLRLSKKAWIIAIGEAGDQLYFGMDAFITAAAQERTVRLRPVSKEELNRALRELPAEGLTITAEAAAFADSIRRLDEPIRAAAALKPKAFACDCHDAGASGADGANR